MTELHILYISLVLSIMSFTGVIFSGWFLILTTRMTRRNRELLMRILTAEVQPEPEPLDLKGLFNGSNHKKEK